MNKKLCFNEISVKKDPHHCCVDIQCKTCDKRHVCRLQRDYRKTATLIENILGKPQLDREIICNNDNFLGVPFPDISIFPETIKAKRQNEILDSEGTFFAAKWSNTDIIKLLYKIDNYFVLFIFSWNEEQQTFTLIIERELYYYIPYIMNEESKIDIVTILNQWREDKKEEWDKEKWDIINTTHFSCLLRCEYYMLDKNIKINPLYNSKEDDCSYKHLATFHIEKNQIQELTDFNEPTFYYPLYLPKPPCPPPHYPKPKRREDLNG